MVDIANRQDSVFGQVRRDNKMIDVPEADPGEEDLEDEGRRVSGYVTVTMQDSQRGTAFTYIKSKTSRAAAVICV